MAKKVARFCPVLLLVPCRRPASLSETLVLTGSMLGILYAFWGMGFLIFMKKGSFFLPRVMWAKLTSETWGLGWFRVWGQFGFVGIKA